MQRLHPLMQRCVAHGAKPWVRGFRPAYPLLSRQSHDRNGDARTSNAVMPQQSAFGGRYPASYPMSLARVHGLHSNAISRQSRAFSLKSINWKMFHPQNMWIALRDFCLHLKHGTVQFGRDMRVAWGYLKLVVKGEELTRQQRRHLNQTVADMFRLVPFSIFVIVPFLELLLPVALAVFPNMLPTSFQSQSEKAAKQLRETKARIEYAKFLQDTLAEMTVDLKKRSKSGEITATADELMNFLHKLKAGEISSISSFEITKFRKIFAEELPLWKLKRPQLQELCRFMSIAPFGPDALLRVNLRLALNNIKKDDRELFSIGVENLPYEELKLACRARGIRTDFSGDHDIPREQREAFLRKQLDAWIHLSLKENLSNSLLLMLQVFSITQVAEVGQEVHKTVTADIHEEIDRERELELIQEELQDEKKEKEQSRLIALAKAMKAEGALLASDRRVQQVQEELQEVKEDIEDTIRRLKELSAMSAEAAADTRAKASAALLEKRLAAMTTALDHAMALLPKRLAAEEEKEKTKKKKEKEKEQEKKRKSTEAVLAEAVAQEKAALASMSSAADKVQKTLDNNVPGVKVGDASVELSDTIDDTIDDSPPAPPAKSPAEEHQAAVAAQSPAEQPPATASSENSAANAGKHDVMSQESEERQRVAAAHR